MKIEKSFLLAGILAILTILVPATQALAGGGIEPPPPGAIIEGPEIWGVVVIFCLTATDGNATVRFKRVVDCNVETEALVDPSWPLGCPEDGAGIVGESLPEGTTVFGKSTPFINKVKNFNKEGNIVSFDAQFKYWHR